MCVSFPLPTSSDVEYDVSIVTGFLMTSALQAYTDSIDVRKAAPFGTQINPAASMRAPRDAASSP